MAIKQEFINYLYSLLGYVQYEISVTKKLCEKEHEDIDKCQMIGRLEALESMLVYIGQIIDKYLDTHNN